MCIISYFQPKSYTSFCFASIVLRFEFVHASRLRFHRRLIRYHTTTVPSRTRNILVFLCLPAKICALSVNFNQNPILSFDLLPLFSDLNLFMFTFPVPHRTQLFLLPVLIHQLITHTVTVTVAELFPFLISFPIEFVFGL